jgi:cobalt-zinc-cadmium efflux system outer membrane protein
MAAPLSADEAVRAAVAANKDLEAARLAIDVARGRLLQAGRPANPELLVSLADDFAFRDEGERSVKIALAQRVPIGARLSRERELAERDVIVAEAEVREVARLLVADVLRTFYAVRALEQRGEAQLELVESLRSIEETTARRARAAEASAADVSLLRIERMRREQEAMRLARERDVARTALARLLGKAPAEMIEPVGELDPRRGAASTTVAHAGATSGDTARPDLAAASRKVERAGADRALARAEVWEDWTVRVGVERDRQPFDDPIGTKRDSLLALDVSVPLPLWDRQQGRIATAEAEVRRARREHEALALRIDHEVQAAEIRLRALRESADAYADEILPETTRARELVERGYRQGLAGIVELLEAQRQYNEARLLYVDLVRDLREAAIALEAARGSSPHLAELLRGGGMR